MKKIVRLTMLLFLIGISAIAQERKISGTVTNSKDNSAIPGATVLVKGSTKGAVTDINGRYELMLPQGADTLQFSFVGMKKKEVAVGNREVVNVGLDEEAMDVGEVVVTAMGISREKKSLGYSTQEVNGKDLNNVKSGSFVNQMSGRVAGVQIKNTGNLGGSTNVIIRGTTSLLGENQALFIVDGVPIDNSRTHTFGQARGTAGYDYGSPVSDINPEDIESINVLKGAAATALYGSRAARGVVLITTKKGKQMAQTESKRLGVTFSTNATFGMVDKKTFPTYQNEYGAGYGPYYGGANGQPSPGDHFFVEDVNGDGDTSELVTPYTEDASYGGQFDPNLLIYQWASFVPGSPTYHQATPWIDHASNEDEGPISFFQTAASYTNNVAIEGGNDRGIFRVSVGSTNATGILPNSRMNRYNFGVNAGYKFTEKFSASASVNYVKDNNQGRNETGYGNNILTSFRQWYQTNVSVKELKEIYDLTAGNFGWNPASSDNPAIPIYWDNPYFQRYKSFSSDSRDRVFGNLEFKYAINKHFDVTARMALDIYSAIQEERIAKTSNAKQFGIGPPGVAPPEVTSGYSRLNKNVWETNLDLIANYKTEINEDFSFSALIGANFRRNYLNTIYASTNGGLVVPELYSISNSVNTPSASVEQLQQIGVNGYFASASFGYKRFLYLDLTGRMDYSSTLPVDNNNYFYPGASASFIFSELVHPSWLDFGKVRLNVAQVGNDAPWGSVYDVYTKPISFGSTTLFSLPITKNNNSLKPELSLTTEAGLEMAFFKRRLGFDFAWYTTDTKNQILPVAVTTATGYSSKYVNAGTIRNKGFEISLYGTPVEMKDFSWKIIINYAANKNEVRELFEGVNNVQITNFQQGVTLNATVGEAYGTLKGTDFVYIDGKKVVGQDGYYKISETATNNLGNINPDYNMGITNAFSYKKWTFSFLIDIQKGGKIFSLDQAYGRGTGLYPETVGINDLGNPIRNTLADGGGVILEGVLEDGSPNNIRVPGDDYALWGWASNPNSAFIYDASYVKLREVALGYSFSLKPTCFFSNINFSIVGSNLWIIDKNLPYADPEAGLSAGNIQGYQTGVLPSTRNFGFNASFQF